MTITEKVIKDISFTQSDINKFQEAFDLIDTIWACIENGETIICDDDASEFDIADITIVHSFLESLSNGTSLTIESE